MSDQPTWNPWQPQGQPQYPSQQPYGQQPYPQGQPPYGQQNPGQYPAQSPYHGQQYAPPGTQPPYPGPGYGYGPQPPEAPRRLRKRHRVRKVILGAGGLIVAIIVVAAIASAGSPGHTVATGQAAASPSVSASKAAKPGAAAKVGSTITLAGNCSGERVAVTVTKIYRHAQPASSFDDPDTGDRLVAVQFRLTDTGSAAYSDSPSNGAEVVDASGQSYQSAIENAANCPSFPGTENIAPGASGLGCVVFEVPQAAVITKVQFTLDSGMGPQTGQWNVGRDARSPGGGNSPSAAEPTFTYPGDRQCRITYRDNGNGTMSWTANVTVAGELITHASDSSGNIYRHDEQISPGLTAFTAPVRLSQINDIGGVLYVPNASSSTSYGCSVAPQR